MSVDGSGDAYPIGECDDASRVIKYVVLSGCGSNSRKLYEYNDLIHLGMCSIRVLSCNKVKRPSG